MPELIWTTEPPTQEGWYWAIPDRNYDKNPRVVFVTYWETQECYKVDEVGEEYQGDLSDFTHWYGPLPVPERP